MKSACVGLATLAVLALGTATALAQPAASDAKAESDKSNTKFAALALSAASGGDVQEEVEILRRLLDKSLTAVYGPLAMPGGPIYYNVTGAGMPRMGMGSMMGGAIPPGPYSRAERPAPDLQGVYLKDYGVVYTVTLPPPPNGMAPGPTAGIVTRTPLSPWERTRKELRGEKIEDEGKTVNGAGLSDVILKVLADNGQHFTRLTEGERITVVVTFRDDAANGIYHPPPGAWGSPAGMGSAGPPAPGGGSASSGSPPGGSSVPQAPSEDSEVWQSDVDNAVRLGDLHLKRGKSQDAITAYKEALARLEKEVSSQRSALGQTPAGPGEVRLLLKQVDLCNKIAQVYVQMGDSESGRAMIQRGSKLAKQAEALTGGAAEANPRPSTPALPSKLIVTASKKLLDEVGAGKMTFEAFRKAATVESVKPPAAEKK